MTEDQFWQFVFWGFCLLVGFGPVTSQFIRRCLERYRASCSRRQAYQGSLEEVIARHSRLAQVERWRHASHEVLRAVFADRQPIKRPSIMDCFD